LAKARDILLTQRPAATPVVLARNLGRGGEQVTATTLGALTPDSADMLTTVIVGASTTRTFRFQDRDWVYTPRGYGVAP
jgi:cobalt-precorrin 5A hydrolase/precorrin-3B C17-methyltransferase